MNDPNDPVTKEMIAMLANELICHIFYFGEKHKEILSEKIGLRSLITSSIFSCLSTILNIISETEEFLDGLFKYIEKSKGLKFSARFSSVIKN